MNGYLSEEALEAYAKLVAEAKGLDFAEGETYDFARCVRLGESPKTVVDYKEEKPKVQDFARKVAKKKAQKEGVTKESLFSELKEKFGKK